MHIKSLNFQSLSSLIENSINFKSEYAILSKNKNSILSTNNLDAINHFKTTGEIQFENFNETEYGKLIIATGTRPTRLSDDMIPGISHAIDSDDLFFLKSLPKKVVLIGAGYIGMESACFLNRLGSEVTVIARSKVMRTFDQQVIENLKEKLNSKKGMYIKEGSSPLRIEKISSSPDVFNVFIRNQDGQEEVIENVNSVILAVGRSLNSQGLNLQSVPEIKLHSKTNKPLGWYDNQRLKISENMYCLGDALEGEHELTPVAIKSGRLLARRLFEEFNNFPQEQRIKEDSFSYNYVPTTVFTSPEMSTLGYSQEDAQLKFGKENIKCYHRQSQRLESVLYSEPDLCYFKVVCLLTENGNEQVIGLHYLGKNAGEIMQGYTLALSKGITKQELNDMIGIHPTVSEEFNSVNKSSDDHSIESGSC